MSLNPNLNPFSNRPSIQPDRYLKLFEKLSPLVGSHSIEGITTAACDLVAGLLQVEACSILQPDAARGGLVIRGATHIPRDEWPAVCIPFGQGLCGKVYASGVPLLLRGASDFGDHGMKHQKRYGRASCVIAPLVTSDGYTAGVINIASPRKKRPFNERDVELIQSASRLIAAGLESARLFNHTFQTQRRLEEIFDNLQVGVVALDSKFQVLHQNHRFSELFGPPPATTDEDRTLSGVFDTQLFNVCCRLLREISTNNTVSQERFQGEIFGGRVMFEITASRFQGPGTAGGAYLLMIEDISQDEEVRRLREADSLKRAFLRIISHELRTPLTVLQGTIPLLQACCKNQNGDLVEKLAQVEKLLRPNVQRLSGVVNAILDVVEIENGNLELMLGPLEVNHLVEERVAHLQDMAGQKKIEWKLELAKEKIHIRGDKQRLRQIIFELMSNAIKFSDPGSVVGVRTGILNGMAAIWIANRGEPISKENRNIVFERFYQMDHDLTRKTGGAGLGLYLTRNIAKLHGGSVQIVDGEEGETVFLMKLPLLEQVEQAGSGV